MMWKYANDKDNIDGVTRSNIVHAMKNFPLENHEVHMLLIQEFDKKTCLYQTSSHLLSKNSSACRNYTREMKEFRRIILVNFLNISVCCIISSINNPHINHSFQNLNMTDMYRRKICKLNTNLFSEYYLPRSCPKRSDSS